MQKLISDYKDNIISLGSGVTQSLGLLFHSHAFWEVLKDMLEKGADC